MAPDCSVASVTNRNICPTPVAFGGELTNLGDVEADFVTISVFLLEPFVVKMIFTAT